jgi:hypothetical protein
VRPLPPRERSRVDAQPVIPSQRARCNALAALALISALPLGACQSGPTLSQYPPVPAAGRRLQATFPTFRTELHFHSASSLTWYFLDAEGRRGRTERVDIRVQSVGDRLYLVSWQESSKTTVVQVQDFVRKVIFTNVTRPDGTFFQSQGSFVELPES